MTLIKRIGAWVKGFNWLAGDSVSDRLHVSSGRLFLNRSDVETQHNSIVMSCVNWAGRAFMEPPLQVTAPKNDAMVVVLDHPMALMLRRPQAGLTKPSKMNGRRLWTATIASLMVDGNAYWHKVRNTGGKLIGIDFIPHNRIRAVGELGVQQVLDHYMLSTNGRTEKINPNDIVHFALGVDGDDLLHGLSPLKAAMREVMTDNEINVYSYAILRNMGIISYGVSPAETGIQLDQATADQIKAHLQSQTAGEARGGALVTTMPLKFEKLGLSPEDMAIDKLQALPEERICAVLGIPPQVVQIGAGLDASTFANYKEAREGVTETWLVPMWQLCTDVIDDQLLPEFGNELEVSRFDITQVRALSEDADAVAKRVGDLYKAGVIKRSEARAMQNLESTPEDEIYFTDLQLGGGQEAAQTAAAGKMMAELTRRAEDRRKAFEELERSV